MPQNIYDYIGILGASLILFSFYRTSIGKWTGKSLWFELDNLLGSLGMMVYALNKEAYVSIILNTVWAIVALRGLTSLADRRRKAKVRTRRHR
jgi:lipid-A-disaccharide synthase-like uncharacterized protein